MREFIAIDESDLIEEGITAFENETNEVLYAGDERRMLINSFAYMVLSALKECNYGINQMITSTASEDGLKVQGEDYEVPRLPASSALVNIQFSIDTGKGTDTTIPSGTRVTYDGIHFYKTQESAVVSAGNASVTMRCVATEPGADGYNDISTGMISTLVDNVTGVVSVSNIDVPAGGADEESIEDWRERIVLKKQGSNTAGSESSYIFRIKSSDSSVGDVKVINTSDAKVNAVVLCKDGSIPNSLLLDKIEQYVSEKDKRPLTDYFEVLAPEEVKYSIAFSYNISNDDMDRVDAIKKNITSAVDKFISEQGLHLGKDVNPDTLRKYILSAGAFTVDITSPAAYMEVSDTQVSKIDGAAVYTYEGLR